LLGDDNSNERSGRLPASGPALRKSGIYNLHDYKKTAGWRFIHLRAQYFLEKAFFLEAANGLRTNLHLNFFTINSYSFSLQIRLPHLLGVAHRKAYVVAVLLAFTSNFTLLHNQR
jgi:hypothetical protein